MSRRDEIVEEVRTQRQAILAEANNDVFELVRQLQQRSATRHATSLAQEAPQDVKGGHYVIVGETLGARLKAARTSQGLTQLQLAAKAAVRQSTISRYESDNEREEHSVAHLGAIAKVLGVTLEYLRGGGVSPTEEPSIDPYLAARQAFRAQCRDDDVDPEEVRLVIADSTAMTISDVPSTFDGWFALFKDRLRQRKASRKPVCDFSGT
jgi:transcriptional regulator with XRE-family HTH domain